MRSSIIQIIASWKLGIQVKSRWWSESMMFQLYCNVLITPMITFTIIIRCQVVFLLTYFTLLCFSDHMLIDIWKRVILSTICLSLESKSLVFLIIVYIYIFKNSINFFGMSNFVEHYKKCNTNIYTVIKVSLFLALQVMLCFWGS